MTCYNACVCVFSKDARMTKTRMSSNSSSGSKIFHHFLLSSLIFLMLGSVNSWTTQAGKKINQPFLLRTRTPASTTTTTTTTLHIGTPFEADLYNTGNNNDDDDDDDNNNNNENPYYNNNIDNSLACPSNTKLIIGLNKYSHDTTICAADSNTGNVLYAVSKERITRKKHDSGNVASIIESCLDTLQLSIDSIDNVIMNNHHHRILPLIESNVNHMEWECNLSINGGIEDGYDDEENVLQSVTNKIELSHHLAHAYSTATQSPFNNGLIIVMDGMGETYRTMIRAKHLNDKTYVSDFTLINDDNDMFDIIPSNINEQSQFNYFDYREAETIYTFEKHHNTKGGNNAAGITIKPIFKRFTLENSPPTLYNHGFENMDSCGALYSRASTHIFGDWNACGKVMGLAPWIVHSWKVQQDDNDEEKKKKKSSQQLLIPMKQEKRIMWGKLYSEKENEKFQIDRQSLMGIPLISRMDSELFDKDGNFINKRRYDFDDDDDDNNNNDTSNGNTPTTDDLLLDAINNDNDDDNNNKQRLPTKIALDAITLADRIQIDLEDVIIDFVKYFKEKTGETNLCIAGGVGLNSVLNGKLARDLDFKRTYISPYPGDDGIAVGCCAFGLFGNTLLDTNKNNNSKEEEEEEGEDKEEEQTYHPPIWKTPISPYLGPMPSMFEMKEAIDLALPWIEVEAITNEDRLLNIAVEEIESGGVIAWYNGRSELGPRALGHRSILADPRKKGLVRFINQHVKKRESFRPFAPSVLEEYANEWFDLGDITTEDGNNKSPYMSLTAMVHKEKRKRIPAVTHVDGSSRLQTVTPDAEPLYHKLITKFYELTGVPMVLNTSFNTLPSEPIVETPKNAIRSFLCSMGSIELLIMGNYIIRRKKPNLRKLLGSVTKTGDEFVTEPACPKRAGYATFQSSFHIEQGETEPEGVDTTSKVQMPDRPMHNERDGGWFTLLDDLEGELLSVCDGTVTMNDIIAQYTAMGENEEIKSEHVEDTEVLLQNIVHRLVRMYEHTLISW